MKVSFLSILVFMCNVSIRSCTIRRSNNMFPNLKAYDTAVTNNNINFSGGGNEPFCEITIFKRKK